MILSVGLTPAWQQIMRFDSLRAGHVNRASEVHWCASGKVLNVSLALAHLGASVEAIAFLGGTVSQPIDREFAALGVTRNWIKTESPTRVCTTLLDLAQGQVTELVQNAGPVSDTELAEFVEVYTARAAAAQPVVLSGSLPAGVPRTLYRDLLRVTPCPALLDISGEELLLALGERPAIVKPNREELARTLGRDVTSDAALRQALRELRDRGAQSVVVTSGAAPVWLSTSQGERRVALPKVTVVNPIGSGDCLAAGMAWGLSQALSTEESLRLGIAAAIENTQQLLPARVDSGRVREQAASLTVENVV